MLYRVYFRMCYLLPRVKEITSAWLAAGLLAAQAQPLVVAGGNTFAAKQRALALLQEIKAKDWNLSHWTERCRKNGFSCIGDEHVVYLIPFQYTPDYVDQFIKPLYEYLWRLPEGGALSKDLPSPFREQLLQIFESESLQFYLTSTDLKTFQQMVRAGYVWIEAGDLWVFEIDQPLKSRYLFRSLSNPRRPYLAAKFEALQSQTGVSIRPSRNLETV